MSKEFYSDLYETLYAERGYHADLDYDEHSKQSTTYLIDLRSRESGLNSVLDVGCSNGKAVQVLSESGFDAHGIDVSPTAIKMALGRGLANFQVGGATRIPHGDSSFDVILSTDVLEHLRPEDLPLMLSEFARVARKGLLVKIALVPEYHKFTNEPLHLSLFPALEWLRIFHPKFRVAELLENCPDFMTVYFQRRDDEEPWESVTGGYFLQLYEKEVSYLKARARRCIRAMGREQELASRLKNELREAKEQNLRLIRELSTPTSGSQGTDRPLAEQKKIQDGLRRRLSESKDQIQKLKHSASYRLGRFILSPFRLLSRVFRKKPPRRVPPPQG